MYFFPDACIFSLKNMHFFSKICNFSQKYAIFSQKYAIFLKNMPNAPFHNLPLKLKSISDAPALKIIFSGLFPGLYSGVSLIHRYHTFIQGPRNDLFLRGALIKRKMRFCLFPKILLNKSPILRGARAPLAPLGPRPLVVPH